MRIRSLAMTIGVVAAVALAGCASTKSGDGSFVGPSGGDTVATSGQPSVLSSTAPPTTDAPTTPPPTTPPPTTPPTTTPPPTTQPPTSSNDTVKPHCAGGKIAAPSDAPYCFVVPSGFIGPGPATLDTAKWPVAIQLSKGTEDDIIVTGIFFASINTDTLSDNVLAEANDTVVGGLSGLDFESTKGKLSKVPGGRAIEYHATDPGSGIKIDMYFIFNGYTKLQVNCQSKTKEAEVNAGCKKVVDSVRLVSIPQ